MTDRVKIVFAVFVFLLALLLPWVGLGVGWYNWDFQTGIVLMLATFIALLILGGLALWRVKDLNWLAVSLPYLLSVGYTVGPDPILLGADDAAVTVLGSLMTYALALRRDPNTPRWILIPLLAAAVYVFFGGVIPGGLDELLVNLVAFAVATAGASRTAKEA
ncbi:MAG: hypothetical protein ACOYYS_09780 [Chloroflexota bacterium]